MTLEELEKLVTGLADKLTNIEKAQEGMGDIEERINAAMVDASASMVESYVETFKSIVDPIKADISGLKKTQPEEKTPKEQELKLPPDVQKLLDSIPELQTKLEESEALRTEEAAAREKATYENTLREALSNYTLNSPKVAFTYLRDVLGDPEKSDDGYTFKQGMKKVSLKDAVSSFFNTDDGKSLLAANGSPKGGTGKLDTETPPKEDGEMSVDRALAILGAV